MRPLGKVQKHAGLLLLPALVFWRCLGSLHVVLREARKSLLAVDLKLTQPFWILSLLQSIVEAYRPLWAKARMPHYDT